MTKACRYFGIGRATFCRWKVLYGADGEAGLVDKKPIPKNPINRTLPVVAKKLLHLRHAYHYGQMRIEGVVREL